MRLHYEKPRVMSKNLLKALPSASPPADSSVSAGLSHYYPSLVTLVFSWQQLPMTGKNESCWHRTVCRRCGQIQVWLKTFFNKNNFYFKAFHCFILNFLFCLLCFMHPIVFDIIYWLTAYYTFKQKGKVNFPWVSDVRSPRNPVGLRLILHANWNVGF